MEENGFILMKLLVGSVVLMKGGDDADEFGRTRLCFILMTGWKASYMFATTLCDHSHHSLICINHNQDVTTVGRRWLTSLPAP